MEDITKHTAGQLIERINKRAFEYQKKHGFDSFFDFLFEDLSEIW